MKPETKSQASKRVKADVSLSKVLDQNEKVQGLVEEAAADLSALNDDLRKKVAASAPPVAVKSAIKKSEAAEDKVVEAGEKLIVVNKDLAGEIDQLHTLHEELSSTHDQADTPRHAALHDVLTDLPNRALFYDRLEQGIEQAKRHGWTLAVLFVDLNGFKTINDSYGHDAGDSVLKTIVGRLKENARGDEFLCLLMGSGDVVDIAEIATSIVKVIQGSCAIVVHGVTISVRVGASIGISIFPQDGRTATALVTSADEAMYKAKRGKSGYAFARAATS